MIHFDVVNKEKELLELEKQTMSNEFWSDTENSSKVLKRITDLKNKLNNFKKINSGLENLKDMNELLQQETDEELVKELLNNTIYTEKEIDKLEITILLSGNYDMNNAIVTIHPEQEEQKHKIGQKCFIECILDGLQIMDMKLKN